MSSTVTRTRFPERRMLPVTKCATPRARPTVAGSSVVVPRKRRTAKRDLTVSRSTLPLKRGPRGPFTGRAESRLEPRPKQRSDGSFRRPRRPRLLDETLEAGVRANRVEEHIGQDERETAALPRAHPLEVVDRAFRLTQCDEQRPDREPANPIGI